MQPSSTSASAASSAAHSIIDELADRARGKKNIIVYNLPQATGHAADKVSFLALCKTVFNLDVLVTRVIYLGKRLENKHRPLLVCFEHEDNKMTIFLIQICYVIMTNLKGYLLLLIEQNLNGRSM